MPLDAADDDEGAWLLLPVLADSGRAACLSDSERVHVDYVGSAIRRPTEAAEKSTRDSAP